MIDHVSIGVRDLAASKSFYEKVLATLQFRVITNEEDTVGFGKKYSEFWLNARPNMPSEPQDTGTHICIRTPTKAAVDAFHKAAIAAGAKDDGPPGLRPHYSPVYYAAFIRDLDGHRIEVVTFLNS
jgi:catechol 2,3-dioxygenase-like lactoylglutathione lyase family enzyme